MFIDSQHADYRVRRQRPSRWDSGISVPMTLSHAPSARHAAYPGASDRAIVQEQRASVRSPSKAHARQWRHPAKVGGRSRRTVWGTGHARRRGFDLGGGAGLRSGDGFLPVWTNMITSSSRWYRRQISSGPSPRKWRGRRPPDPAHRVPSNSMWSRSDARGPNHAATRYLANDCAPLGGELARLASYGAAIGNLYTEVDMIAGRRPWLRLRTGYSLLDTAPFYGYGSVRTAGQGAIGAQYGRRGGFRPRSAGTSGRRVTFRQTTVCSTGPRARFDYSRDGVSLA